MPGPFAPSNASVAIPISLVTNTKATVNLPSGYELNRAARVRLRFADTPLHDRGSMPWNYSVNVTITAADDAGNLVGPGRTTSLTIFRGMDRESFEAVAVVSPLTSNGAHVEVTSITSSGSLPSDIVLDLEVTGDRVTNFDPAQKPSITVLNGTPSLAVLGSTPDGSISYEFESVFYDKEETQPQDPFAGRDPVRVPVTRPLTLIDTTYPAGTLYVRGRAVGRFPSVPADGPALRPGQWSDFVSVPINSSAVDTSFNWNYVASYAESPDFVSSIGYFDGALRSRQTQTRLLTRNSSLIAETKHDHEGRPTVNFLPAPHEGLRFGYVSQFNAVNPRGNPTTTQAYDASEFDGLAPPPASAANGAGKYFSPSWVPTAPEEAYVPDAGGYPYSVIEPIRDDTGRPRRTSGVGERLRLKLDGDQDDHNVLFHYGTAASSPLHQLFGQNVGRAAYYEHNVVIDSNGQAHIAYVDRAGKVIATALTGSAPNLDPIDHSNLTVMTYRLDENNVVDKHAGISRSVSHVTVENPDTNLFFSYDLAGVQYSAAELPFPPLCQSCRYQLTIHITDPDGNPVSVRPGATLQNDPSCAVTPIDQEHQFEISEKVGAGAPDQNSCSAPGAHSVAPSTPPSDGPIPVKFCAKLSATGEYEVVKGLELIDGSLQNVVDQALSAPNVFEATSYTPDQEDQILRCQTQDNCDTFCKEAAPPSDEAQYQCKDTCRNPQHWVSSTLAKDVADESCKALKDEIEADIAPGGIIGGTSGKQVSQHPEYCHIKEPVNQTSAKLPVSGASICERGVASDTFDNRMMLVDNYRDALCAGYLDPLEGSAGAPARPGSCGVTREHDPFVDHGQIGESMRQWMKLALEDYAGRMPGFSTLHARHPHRPSVSQNLQHQNIWQVAAQPIYPNQNPPSDDEEWRMFRSLYMGVKQTALALHLEDQHGSDYCPYWNDKHAHVKRPYTFDTIGEAEQAANSSQANYCADQCSTRTTGWIDALETACRAQIPGFSEIPVFYKSLQLVPNLRQYCRAQCSSTNPLPVITANAVATDQSLNRATQPLFLPPYQLPQACTLSLIANANPATGGSSPVGVSSYIPKVGDDPEDIIKNVVDSHYQFPNDPQIDPNTALVKECTYRVKQWADQQGVIGLNKAKADFKTFVQEQHYTNCFGPQLKESFSYQAVQGEYHFTLYYFDQAGDLVQTVPPEGVHPLSDADVATLESGDGVANPTHKLTSSYHYNSLGQITQQVTPDGGSKYFWYNAQGQLRLSQNAQQQADNQYGYLLYDGRGRVIESGLLTNTPPSNGTVVSWKADQVQAYSNCPVFPEGICPALPSPPNYKVELLVKTTYDHAPPECQSLNTRNLRGRIAGIVAATAHSYGDAITCYSYDPHGNITTLSQAIPGLDTKIVSYEYDILDGKILATHYQPGSQDQLHHRYTYDADRRLSTVETSRDGELWERDAAYAYYLHGPLARVELGADRVQGLDYTYTITGWPKGVNSDTLTPERDPGRDGQAAATNIAVARDVFGSAVHYFPNDFTPIGAAGLGTNLPQAKIVDPASGLSKFAAAACTSTNAVACGLFDGNVANTISAVSTPNQAGSAILGTAYSYDQLYRLRTSTTFADKDVASNRWPQTSADPNLWRTDTKYDANGNIKSLKRCAAHDPTTSVACDIDRKTNGVGLMDDLTYQYNRDANGDLTSNRLDHINDSVPANAYPDDLDDQQPNNYTYDQSGRLVRDNAAGLNKIAWNAASRVAIINRANDTIEFLYDGVGNRVAKIIRSGADPTTWQYEYFVRDEKGQILATYKSQAPGSPGAQPAVALQDQTIFGATRLGTWAASSAPALTLPGPPSGVATPPTGLPTTTPLGVARYSRVRGDKQYELANYLGNVEATITDRKNPVTTSGVVTHYEAQQVNSSAYYPFGELMPILGAETQPYRFGFSGLERDDELKGAGNSYYTSARLFDPRVARWLSPDSIEVADSSPFVGFSNNPLRYADPKGKADKDAVNGSGGRNFSGMGPTSRAALAKARFEAAADSERGARQWHNYLYNQMSGKEQAGWFALQNIGGEQVGEAYAGETIEQRPLNFEERVNSAFEGLERMADIAVDIVTVGGELIGLAGEARAVKEGANLAEDARGLRPELPCGSFAPDTLVQTDRGPERIADVRTGDFVLSRNEATGQEEFRRVDQAFSRVHSSSVRLLIRREHGDLEQITTTLEHPFLVAGRGWTWAGDIIARNSTIWSKNEWLAVERADHIPGDIVEYDLTINGFHTFFVGQSEVWVHNANAPCDVPKGGTYVLKDEDKVMRSGRSNDLARRGAEHARDPNLKDYTFEPVDRTDVYKEQRGLEQMLHKKYNPPLNKVKGISPKNPKLKEYMDAAKDYKDKQ